MYVNQFQVNVKLLTTRVSVHHAIMDILLIKMVYAINLQFKMLLMKDVLFGTGIIKFVCNAAIDISLT